jgi:DNA-directed RNA polymerase subunit omega
MIDALKEEEIVRKVGGRFKLSTLIQKRLAALNAGARALVEVQSQDKMEVVVEEILQDKIYLDSSSRLQLTSDASDKGGPPELDLSSL